MQVKITKIIKLDYFGHINFITNSTLVENHIPICIYDIIPNSKM
jgi:hypothetical protein